ncbi:MAG: transketolase C-terminal domain-containing protein [Janthinobacterium lividum]
MTLPNLFAPGAALLQRPELTLRDGLLKLLAIKDSDVRLLTLRQSAEAVDSGLHAGGAFSATIPMVALFYGGFLRLNIEDPTAIGQDIFTLSKGHAVATMASIYAEIGYFDEKLLTGSRSHHSLLNGHPGPILPGVHIATGPMGQGIGVAQGFAIAGRQSPRFDSYAMVGDGELQEGSCWETIMYAGQSHLDNLCVLVDRNYGQLDVHNRTLFPMPPLAECFRSFGWDAHNVDATQYDGVVAALHRFRFGPRDGRPTAIICNTTKGYGAFSDFMNKHKVTGTAAVLQQEIALQQQRRIARVSEFREFLERLSDASEQERLIVLLSKAAEAMHLQIDSQVMSQVIGPVLTKRVPPRDKTVNYDAAKLPVLDRAKQYAASDMVTAAMKVFAADARVVSIDSDLASTSGLEAGVASVDQQRALNVGVAEANMMLIGEAMAALGKQTWTSTFCPFFNWQVLRRIAVGQQERLEAIEAKDGWLSEGHGLDLTFLATAADFETRTNGATHMGNDDLLTFDATAQVKIVNVSCPQQMLSLMRWTMEGNRGLLYVRVMRTPSPVLHGADYTFEFGKGEVLRRADSDTIVLISSGRGVHEALAAAELCAKSGVGVTVVDMPSVDDSLLVELASSGKTLVFAEQNNGYLWLNFGKVLYRHRDRITGEPGPVLTINTLDKDGKPQFIHSATYEELTEVFGLSAAALAQKLLQLANPSS